MHKIVMGIAIAVFATVFFSSTSFTSALAGDQENNGKQNKVELYDNCDPSDPAWAPTGGCVLDKKEGNVSFAEFSLFLTSPLAVMQLVGHPSWRMEPSYMTIVNSTFVEVENEGGREHTFTEVQNYGGGRIPQLNQGQISAPECALAPGATDPHSVLPGKSLRVGALPLGLHKFQCCIHPWMRSVVRVDPRKEE